MAEVKLPMVGAVPKKALMIGGVAAVGVVGFIYLKKKKSGAAAASASTDTTGAPQIVGYDANGNPIYSDGSSGDYLSPGLQDTSQGPTFGSTGYYDPNTGQWVYGPTGTGQAQATTNAQWAQQAISYLAQSSVTDPAALSSALGAYLTGKVLTADQVSLVDQAIAIEGYPPVAGNGGYPPGMHEAGTPSQGGTGGSGGGVTGGGGGSGGGSGGGVGTWAYPAPGGLKVTKNSGNGYHLAWTAPKAAGHPAPASYTVATYSSKGTKVGQQIVTGLSALEFGSGGHGLPKGTYHTNVWANGGPKAPAHASVTVILTR